MKRITKIFKLIGGFTAKVLLATALIGFMAGAIDEVYFFCTDNSFTLVPTFKFIAWIMGK